MGDLYAFVDESGNEGMQLDKPDVSALYVVVAMLLTEEELPKAQEVFHRAKASHFKQHLEMKSSHIGDDHQKRTHVLTDLLPMLHRVHLAQQAVRQATGGGLDILAVRKEHAQLKRAVEAGADPMSAIAAGASRSASD